jgi:hypothetical protein
VREKKDDLEEGKLAEVAEPQEVWSKGKGSYERWSGQGRRALRVEFKLEFVSRFALELGSTLEAEAELELD